MSTAPFPPSLDAGDTAWMMTSTALVLTMSPALAMFEAGLLRSKNTLSIFTQVFAGLIVLSVLWLLVGYSLTFGDSTGVVGNPLQHALFMDVSYTAPSVHAPRIPAAAFALFQLMFAVIAPLLVTGAYAERMPFRVFIAFSVLFSLLVYCPVAHCVWGGGFLSRWGAQDFAGGITIHTTAGVAALVSAVMIGQRADFDLYGGEFPPSNLPLAAVGCGLLWLGWMGFNGGSALSASGGIAVSACVSTQIGAVSSGFVWLTLSWYTAKPSSSALMNGLLAGLAGVTPASGYIGSPATLLLGAILGLASFGAVHVLKRRLRVDDALDVSSVHGVTGIVGSLYIGLFGQKEVNPAGADGWLFGSARLLGVQAAAVVIVILWTAVVTWAILLVCRLLFGSVRVSAEEETVGLDWAAHGEVAYHKLSVLEDWEKRQDTFTHFAPSEREAGWSEEQRRSRSRRTRSSRARPTLIAEVGDDDGENGYEVAVEEEEGEEAKQPTLLINARVVTPGRKGRGKRGKALRGPDALQSPFLPHADMTSALTPPPANDAYRRNDATAHSNGRH